MLDNHAPVSTKLPMSHQGFSESSSFQEDCLIKPRFCLQKVSLQAALGTGFLLKDISFMTQAKEVISLVGASGSGKTSLLRLLNGLVSPSSGIISLDEQPLEFYSPIELRRRLVLVPQEPKLMGMRVDEALAYPLKLQQRSLSEIQAQIETWTSLLHIPTEWFAKTELQLSLGQRQLVTIARALTMQPQIILLDEPTSALDVGTANHVLNVLKKLNQEQGLTIIMVNHQLELIQNFCDRILLLDQGLLLKDMTASESNWQEVEAQIYQSQSQQAQEWL